MARKPRTHRVWKDDLSKRLASGRILPRDLLVVDRTKLTEWVDDDLISVIERDKSTEVIYKTQENFITTLKEMSPFIIERRYFVSDEKFDLVLQLSYVHDPDYTSYHNFLHPETFDQGAGI